MLYITQAEHETKRMNHLAFKFDSNRNGKQGENDRNMYELYTHYSYIGSFLIERMGLSSKKSKKPPKNGLTNPENMLS